VAVRPVWQRRRGRKPGGPHPTLPQRCSGISRRAQHAGGHQRVYERRSGYLRAGVVDHSAADGYSRYPVRIPERLDRTVCHGCGTVRPRSRSGAGGGAAKVVRRDAAVRNGLRRVWRREDRPQSRYQQIHGAPRNRFGQALQSRRQSDRPTRLARCRSDSRHLHRIRPESANQW
jgi:hypothetical protein